MKKVSVPLFIIISLLAASFAGIGAPRASAAGLTVTPGSTATGGYSTSMTVQFTPSYTVSYMTLSLPGFTFPSSLTASISGGTSSAIIASGSGNAVYLTFASALAAGYTYNLYLIGYITNPSTAGTYTATATLSGSGTQALTGTVAIGGSTGSDSLVVTPGSTATGGYSTSMTVQFTPSYTVSYMTLSLPGFTFPSSLTASISGGTSSAIIASGSGNAVYLTFASALAAGYTYNLYLIGYITNPSTAGTYTATATLSGSGTQTLTYTLTNLPHTALIVSPGSPDGLSGYYKTRPTVTLSAGNTTSSVFTTYYSLNNGSWQAYTGPIQLPDGTDTLAYYSRDQQGNQDSQQIFTAKVDATTPTATITSPADAAVVGKSPVTVTGKVSPGRQLNVAGKSVAVSTAGDFSVDVPLTEGPQTVIFTVTSVSGNVGKTQLKITLSTTPPALTITKPAMYSKVTTSVCEVDGKTEPGAIVKVAGIAVTVNADGTFTQNVMLKEGDNVINVTAANAAGNVRTVGIPVNYKSRIVMTLQIGNKNAMINDAKSTLQSVPVIMSGHTLVPLRFISEAFGATVDWDGVYKIVTIELKGKIVRLQVGAKSASVAGKSVKLETPPVIIKGFTMVPIRFISEAFGAQVVWNAPTRGIVITYPKP